MEGIDLFKVPRAVKLIHQIYKESRMVVSSS